MNYLEVMKKRHSVRTYNDRGIEIEKINILKEFINECNVESGLNIQLVLNDSRAFKSKIANYGKFSNVNNYIAIIGKKTLDLNEKTGYYGEKIVLKVTELGLGSCWVASTYSKGKTPCIINKDEKLVCVIAIGHYDKPGKQHKSKPIEELVRGEIPDWFRKGMEAVQLAPTALNQQKFIFSLEDNIVDVKSKIGVYTKIDVGIVKYHFELGANEHNKNWKWKQ